MRECPHAKPSHTTPSPQPVAPGAEGHVDPVLGICCLQHQVLVDDAQGGDKVAVETGLARTVPDGGEGVIATAD